MATAIEFENVGKQYRLGLVSTRTLSHDLERWWTMNILGKEDPYLTIGETNDRATKGESEYVWALKDINFKVEQGDVVGIIGRNGAGKSTLLKLLSKVTGPTTGSIRARGRIGSLLEVGTGFHGEMTGRENIYMNGAILGMTKPEIASKLDEIIDFSGCERYIDTPVKRYSSGMTVRLGFAVAAFLDPEILVVDEVLAVGDAEFQKKAIGKMKDVSRGEGRTVLFVSHNMASIRHLCNTGIVLKNGCVDFTGNVDESVDYYMRTSIPSILDCPVSDMPREGHCSGAIHFNNILFLNEANDEIIPHCGGYLKIRLFFHVKEEIKNCNISIGINDNADTRILSFQSQMTKDPFYFSQGNHHIDCIIPKLPLTGGSYKLGLWSDANGTCADHIYYSIKLDVDNDDFFGTGRSISSHLSGRVALCEHSWSVGK